MPTTPVPPPARTAGQPVSQQGPLAPRPAPGADSRSAGRRPAGLAGRPSSEPPSLTAPSGALHTGSGGEAAVHDMLKRHAIQVLLDAGHSQEEIAKQLRVGVRTVRRILNEEPVTDVDDAGARKRRRIGRPSKVESYRELVTTLLGEEPGLKSLEILRRCRAQGYDGGKSALYELVAELRGPVLQFHMRFEGLPGEFSQHDFGEVVVHYVDGAHERLHFFASRLKWSRWSWVTIVPNQRAETLIRVLLEHFEHMGGVPLCAVFDRPKTVALRWSKDGKVSEWNPIFACAAMEIGFTAEVCWPHQPQQKGSVENLVGWVKGSFFKQRQFHDRADLLQQLEAWHVEVNDQRPSRATGAIPAERLREERPRLRAPKVASEDLALRLPIQVGPTAHVTHDGHLYSMPPEAAGVPGTLYLYRDRVRIVAGRHQAHHARQFEAGARSTLPEHRAQQLASVAGRRGKRYLMRQHLLETGPAAERFLTELVHLRGPTWVQEVDRLHDLLERYGADAMHRALRAAVDVSRYDAAYVARCLADRGQGRIFEEEQA